LGENTLKSVKETALDITSSDSDSESKYAIPHIANIK